VSFFHLLLRLPQILSSTAVASAPRTLEVRFPPPCHNQASPVGSTFPIKILSVCRDPWRRGPAFADKPCRPPFSSKVHVEDSVERMIECSFTIQEIPFALVTSEYEASLFFSPKVVVTTSFSSNLNVTGEGQASFSLTARERGREPPTGGATAPPSLTVVRLAAPRLRT
jgi:hypothetical protein